MKEKRPKDEYLRRQKRAILWFLAINVLSVILTYRGFYSVVEGIAWSALNWLAAAATYFGTMRPYLRELEMLRYLREKGTRVR